MANVLVNDSSLADIADAIREKNGTEETYKPAEMGDAVRAIESGGGKGIIFSEFNEKNLPQVVDASNLPKPEFANSIVNMFYRAFANASGNDGNGFYTAMIDVYLPNWLEGFPQEMFMNCKKLKRIYGNFESVTQIDTKAFSSCASLEEMPYLPRLGGIASGAFQNCTGLTEVRLYEIPQNISSGLNSAAFSGCTNITDIYVPWAEGTVANAPWGATNATIHYNTVYDENHEPIV